MDIIRLLFLQFQRTRKPWRQAAVSGGSPTTWPSVVGCRIVVNKPHGSGTSGRPPAKRWPPIIPAAQSTSVGLNGFISLRSFFFRPWLVFCFHPLDETQMSPARLPGENNCSVSLSRPKSKSKGRRTDWRIHRPTVVAVSMAQLVHSLPETNKQRPSNGRSMPRVGPWQSATNRWSCQPIHHRHRCVFLFLPQNVRIPQKIFWRGWQPSRDDPAHGSRCNGAHDALRTSATTE